MENKYYIKGNLDLNRFTDYSMLSKAIRKIVPKGNFQITEKINGVYKKAKIKKIDFEVGIVIPKYEKEPQKKFEEIKSRLEEILEIKLTKIKEK